MDFNGGYFFISEVYSLFQPEVLGEPDELIEENGNSYYKVPRPHKKISISELEISGKTIKSPYIIHMLFKITKPVLSSIFSIEDAKTVYMMMQFSAAGPRSMRVKLVIKDAEEIDFEVVDILDTFADILLFVEEDKVTIFDHCEQIESKNVSGSKSVEFSNDRYLVLGKSSKYPTFNDFEVSSFFYYNNHNLDIRFGILSFIPGL